MSVNYEQNNNHVTSAYGNVKNSKQIENSKIITPKNGAVAKIYKKSNDEVNKKQIAKKRTQSINNVIKAFALAVSTVVMGVVGINLVTPATIVADVVDLYVYETGVIYYVSLSDLTDDVKIVLHNDFTNRVEYVDCLEFEGSFENLATNMTYTFEIKQGSKTVAKRTFVTREYLQEEYDKDRPNWSDYEDYDYKPTNGKFWSVGYERKVI